MTGIAEESEPAERQSEADIVDKGRRLIQFLAASQRLRYAPVRTLDTYRAQDGAVFWLGEIPDHPAVITAAHAEHPEADTPFLVVRRVAAVPAPEPDDILSPWLDGPVTDPAQPPKLRASRTVDLPEGRLETVQLDDATDVRDSYESWRPIWDTWAERELHDRPVRSLYRDLFTAFNTVSGQPELYELVLGVGCLAWHPAGHDPVCRHVLVTPAALQFDETTGTLTVEAGPSLDAVTAELDMLDPTLAPPAGRYQELVARARALEVNPLDRVPAGDLLRAVVNGLDADGRYEASDQVPAIGAAPVLAFAPAIVLRRRSQAGLIEVFQRIDAAMAETGRVPDGLMPLVDPNYLPPVEPDTTPGAMVTIDDDMFLPLPLNDRQLDIVQRVDRQAQTLVQGPPGTGKTHLAAALISHLLAQGKRVLVTAQTDRALKEVRGKLPAEIRPLAVAVLGSDLTDMADLKVAVEGISRRSTEGDPITRDRQMADAAASCLHRIDQLRARRAELRNLLVGARTSEVSERSFLGYRGTLAAIARTYRDQRNLHGWLVDFAGTAPDADAPLTDAEASQWLTMLRAPDPHADASEAAQALPDMNTLPTPEQLETLLDRLQTTEAEFSSFTSVANHAAFDRVCALGAVERVALQWEMDTVARTIGAFEQRRDPWMAEALADLRSGRGATWEARARTIRGLVDQATKNLRELDPATRVELADGVDRAAIASLAANLRLAVVGGRKVPLNADGSVKIGAFTAHAIKDSRPLFDGVRVDGRPPTTEAELSQVIAHLKAERHLDALDAAWPASVVVPVEDTLQERFQWHATELNLLNQLLVVGRDVVRQSQRLTQLGVPQPDWNNLEAILEFARLVDAAAAREARDAATEPLRVLCDRAASVSRRPDAAQASAALTAAVESRDAQGYRVAHERVAHLLDVRDRVATREALTAQIIAAAPAVVAAVTEHPDDVAWGGRLAALTAAWDWARAGSWILAQETDDANDLEAQLDRAEDEIRHQVELLAGLRAWRQALSPDRLTGQARADLNQYVQLVRRLGKGTGKYAAARRTEIRQAMDNCRPSVPVWIMPIYRIAEQLRVAENMFDVVIVDEASQAGLEATFLQYLAPKIVVIGDDKQVSPAAVGIDQQQLRDLASQYLYDHRYKSSWQDPKLSLFDAAAIWYGAKRTLVEHRRCVPEIIGFSNRIAYEPDGIRLIPVRQFGAERLEPIKNVYVSDGYESGITNKTNRPEAQAIADRIVECLADRAYDGKTFGVISLLGPSQAKLIEGFLLDRVAPEEWAARDLRCGDAAAFQGSERDVMFLSMVSAPAPGQRISARVDDATVQRYNVAASRAKDQMWVVHSVRLDQLSRADDLRLRLLDYCYNTVPQLRPADDGTLAGLVPEDENVAPFDSLFEQRVHNQLIGRGYTVIPQYESMGYRIDLAIVGATTMLAVECDGDFWHGPDRYLADLARERDLRRCGWTFFRIRESAYYVDPHGALEPLWGTLRNLGIWPGGHVATVDEVTAPVEDGPAAAESPVMEVVPSMIEAGVDNLPVVAEPASPESSHVLPAPVEPRQAPYEPARVAPTAATGHPQALGRRFIEPAPTPSGLLKPYQPYSGWAPSVREASTREMDLTLLDIIGAEGPVLGTRAQSAFVGASGGRRVGQVIADQLDASLARLARRGEVEVEDPLNRRRVRERTYRLPSQPTIHPRELGPRDLHDVPPRELAFLLHHASQRVGWNADALFREALHLLGRTRLTAPAHATLSSVVPLARQFEQQG